MTDPTTSPTRTSSPSPASPRSRSASWSAGTPSATFEASVEARPAGEHGGQRVRLLRRAAVRQRPAPLRPPPDGLREGRRAPVPDDEGPPRRAALRLGLPRPARRGGGRAPARAVGAPRDRGLRHRRAFNDACRTSVLRYTQEWERYVTRQARWVDFEHDYKTLDLSYMESVMWAFKSPVGQGLRLRGLPRAAVLLALRDAAVQHRAAHGRRLPRPPGPGRHGGLRARATGAARRRTRILVWTTTPWTLPSNLALAVGERHRVRRVRGGRCPLRARRRRGCRPTRRSSPRPSGWAPCEAASSSDAGTRRCTRSSPTRPTPSWCSPPTS